MPFHISTVKNVTSREDSLRINFSAPSPNVVGKLDDVTHLSMFILK